MIEGGDVATSVDDAANVSCDVTAVTSSRDQDGGRDDDITYDVTDEDEDAFVAGFRDCRREALRYLRQRDHVDVVPGPVCDELERHLAAVERTCRPPPAAAEGPRDADDSALGASLVEERERERGDVGELSERAEELLRLAQNNPRINNIINELFTLMSDDQDEDTDSDDDCLMTCDDDVIQQQLGSKMTSHDAVTDVS